MCWWGACVCLCVLLQQYSRCACVHCAQVLLTRTKIHNFLMDHLAQDRQLRSLRAALKQVGGRLCTPVRRLRRLGQAPDPPAGDCLSSGRLPAGGWCEGCKGKGWVHSTPTPVVVADDPCCRMPPTGVAAAPFRASRSLSA